MKTDEVVTHVANTNVVEPLLSGNLFSGHPKLCGHLSKSRPDADSS